MAFYLCILRCNDGSYYTGHTDDIETRMASHVSGEYGGYTSTRRPVTLVFLDKFPTRYEALRSERQIKGWSRAKKEALIRGDWERIQQVLGVALDNSPTPRCKRTFGVMVDSAQRPSTGSGRTGSKGQRWGSPPIGFG
ncbi:MAG: GIY-YIG nuclease family protein [Dehalococcoidia bacterium]|nr:GIY-YIG nuclease family protein [Dehalococcoidia bacterium]